MKPSHPVSVGSQLYAELVCYTSYQTGELQQPLEGRPQVHLHTSSRRKHSVPTVSTSFSRDTILSTDTAPLAQILVYSKLGGLALQRLKCSARV